MKLKEFIKKNKIKGETFIALHNNRGIWIIADMPDSDRLVDYLEMEVLDGVKLEKTDIWKINIEYDDVMSIASRKYIAEHRGAAPGIPGATNTKTIHRKRTK